MPIKETVKQSSTSVDSAEVSRRSFLTKASVAGAIALSPFFALANAVGTEKR
jgi:hypothetical protein